MGVMAGTLDLVQRSYMGTQVRDGVLRFDPRLPAPIDGLSFSMQFRRTPLLVTLADGRLTLAAHPEGVNRPIKVGVGDQVRDFGPGDRLHLRVAAGPKRRAATPQAREEHACRNDSRERSLTSTECSSTRPTRRPGASRCVS